MRGVIADKDRVCVLAVKTADLVDRAMDNALLEPAIVTAKAIVTVKAAIKPTPTAKAAMPTEAAMPAEAAIATKAPVSKSVMATTKAVLVEPAVKAAIAKPAMPTIKATIEPAIATEIAVSPFKFAPTMVAEFAPMMSFKAGFEAAAMVLCYRWKGNNRDRKGRNGAEFGQCAENAHMNTPFMVVALNSRKGSGHCASGLL